MIGKIIVTLKDGTIRISKFEGHEAVNEAKQKYKFIASEWDYSARTGNPINYYFSE